MKNNITLPPNFTKYNKETQDNIIKYLEYLTPIEYQAYLIAKDHLGSSFNIVKSNGYCDWFKKQSK